MFKPLICKNCSAPISNPDASFCPYCGVGLIDDNKYTYNYNVNQNVNKNINIHKTNDKYYYKYKIEKENNRASFIIFGLLFLLIIFSMLLLFYFGFPEDDYIKPGSYKEYVGENYKSAQEVLENLGFENIETVDLGKAPLFHDKNEVKSVSIDGNTKFKKDDSFEPDVPVIIRYYSK